ncbi:MAG TPA: hypothetical protein VMR18_04725 [Candidatus Saccharimonadales bacterium]|jgi:hypothetical protein|nr:hypothetical protein [Candidatus Saccharimonadales bacterium]
MKQKDLAIIILVVAISGIISYVVSNKIISTPADRQLNVQVAPAINTNFTKPNATYFNSQSIDLTQLIQIGNNSNQTPFNQTTTQ